MKMLEVMAMILIVGALSAWILWGCAEPQQRSGPGPDHSILGYPFGDTPLHERRSP